MFDRREIGADGDLTVLEREASVLTRVRPAISENDVVAIAAWTTKDKKAVLENGGGVAEDEVDGAVDIAFPVELTEGESVESVLVASYATPVHN